MDPPFGLNEKKTTGEQSGRDYVNGRLGESEEPGTANMLVIHPCDGVLPAWTV